MGLYINKELYPRIHLSPTKLSAVNQNEYRQDALSDFLEFQQRLNQKLLESIDSVQHLFQQTNTTHQLQNKEICDAIEKQDSRQDLILNKLEKFETTVLDHLASINSEQQELVKIARFDENQQQALFAQLTVQDQKTNNLLNKISELETFSKQLKQEMVASNYDLSAKIEVQDIYHQTVIERIDAQEAITHKINRQLDNLKAVIFERIADLAEKIEYQSKNTINTLTGIIFRPHKDSKVEKL